MRKYSVVYNIGFQLAAKDENQIKLIMKLMKCNSRIYFRKRKNISGSISFSYSFVANSKQMYYDLDKFNITEVLFILFNNVDALSNGANAVFVGLHQQQMKVFQGRVDWA